MTTQEQLAALRTTREAHQKRLSEIGRTAADQKRSMNTAEAEEFDTIEGEVKRLDDDIARYERLATIEAANAQPVQPVNKAFQPLNAPAEPVRHNDNLSLKTTETLEPGIAFARYAMCMTKAKGNHQLAAQLAAKHFPNTQSINVVLKAQAEGYDLGEALRQKAAVAAGTTSDSTWASPLVYAENYMGDFVSYLRPRTLLGQANFRPIPFNVRVGGQTSGGSAGWVGEGKGKPVTKFDYTALFSDYTKIAAIAVLTQELIRFSDPSAATLVRDQLGEVVIARADTDLFDPDKAAEAGVSPAGLLNGVAPVAVSPIDPSDPASVLCAINELWIPWDSTFLGARPAYYTTPAAARMLSFARDPLGNRAFPQMTPTGGSIDGVPVRVSQYLANNGGSGGAPFILVDESEIWIADDGSVTLDQSTEASIQMDSAPTNASDVPTAAQLVSMFQTNSVAFRAERGIWWGKRRAAAVQWIDGFPTRC